MYDDELYNEQLPWRLCPNSVSSLTLVFVISVQCFVISVHY